MQYEKLCILQTQIKTLEIMAMFENNQNSYELVQENIL